MEQKRQTYHHKDLRNALIETGIQIVSTEGINAFSLRKVAAACGVSHAAPYSHFQNKEELLEAMQLFITDRFSKQLESTVQKNNTVAEILKDMGIAYVSFFVENPAYFQFLYSQSNIKIDLSLSISDDQNYKPYIIYKNIVSKLLEQTHYSEEKQNDIIITIWAFIHGVTSLATMNNVNYDNDWRDKVIDFMDVFQLSFLDNTGEKNMIGIYFSGTGNTKYCLEKFVALYDRNIEITPLEDTGTMEKVTYHKDIIFAYPIYYSNLPKIVRDFICENSDIWKGKRVFIIATMGLFSGDGAGVSARLFERYGAQVWGGLHLKMPDCICDVKALKRTPAQNKQIVIQAEERIKSAVCNLKNGTPTKDGLGFLCHIAGLLGQRLWFYHKTQEYSNKIQIDIDACIKCGKCALVCPMNNLSLSKCKIVANGRCTLCYRCVNQCSEKAITILGKQVIFQHSVYDFH